MGERRAKSGTRGATAAAALVRVVVAAGLAPTLSGGPASAQLRQTLPAGDEATSARTGEGSEAMRRAELDAIVRELDLGEARQTEIRREIESLDRDRVRIAEQLVAAGTRIKAAESRVAASEARLAAIESDADKVRSSLEARRGVLADVLAALQRIGRKPPPAVVVRPEDALASVRSAILIGAVLPELRGEAERLLADLQKLDDLKGAAARERDRFRAEASDLVAERTRLEFLVTERQKARGDQEKRLEDERRRVVELAQKANSLRDLIAGIAAEAAKLPAASDPRTQPGAAARLQPAIAFAEAKGRFALPVAGEVVSRFGDDDGSGGTARGVSIQTGAEARVTSPCDGSVIFAGPFRSYGQLLIINGGGGYHVVLAGMDRIDVELGQFVLAGEPVGRMGARAIATAGTDDTVSQDPKPGDTKPGDSKPRDSKPRDKGRPVLYVEFRRDSASIDPTPWWARTRDEKVRG